MFTLIQLPYAMEALEPVISADTISFHHGKHLQAYVDNLNKLLPGSGFEGLSLVDIVRQAPAGAIFNNAGQILNHEMYFTQFNPAENATEGPVPFVRSQIEKQWGSFEAFKTEFETKGVGLFGSGWVWLAADADGSLVITQEQGASNPVVKGWITRTDVPPISLPSGRSSIGRSSKSDTFQSKMSQKGQALL